MGSSPLARGLLGVQVGCGRGGRIIPARAGFTAVRAPLLKVPSDHPRSRGVYAITWEDDCQWGGSSPLARGLRGGCREGPARRGIIPARAGFTDHVVAGDDHSPDHPRSRGVYPVGLLLSDGPLWIIPARAGFTRGRWRCGPATRDHPRSRGVYGGLLGLGVGEGGSSPLARGLHRLHDELDAGLRIIPARAGFTGRAGQGSHGREDHPRSRGVYLGRAADGSGSTGSSPLARGLPGHPQAPHNRTRIIPARAGFTTAPIMIIGIVTDHPRSRGVYHSAWNTLPAARGSSPLARGLLDPAGLHRGPERIIPARAGFTGTG